MVICGIKKYRFGCCQQERRLGALSTDAAGELDVLGHDGHALGVDGAQVSVLKETNEVSLSGFLEGSNGRRLEAEIRPKDCN